MVRAIASFGRGLPFQENPKTGDARISGTCASLAGLEKAIKEETDREVDLSIRRILLIHAVILTVGGIPLIYLGDEIGVLNDYSYAQDKDKAEDSRWVHRAPANWDKVARRKQGDSVEGRIFQGLQRLIELRKNCLAFGGTELEVINTDNDHILGYLRVAENDRLLVFANFSEQQQVVSANQLRLYGLSYEFKNLFNGEIFSLQDLVLEPYEFACLSS